MKHSSNQPPGTSFNPFTLQDFISTWSLRTILEDGLYQQAKEHVEQHYNKINRLATHNKTPFFAKKTQHINVTPGVADCVQFVCPDNKEVSVPSPAVSNVKGSPYRKHRQDRFCDTISLRSISTTSSFRASPTSNNVTWKSNTETSEGLRSPSVDLQFPAPIQNSDTNTYKISNAPPCARGIDLEDADSHDNHACRPRLTSIPLTQSTSLDNANLHQPSSVSTQIYVNDTSVSFGQEAEYLDFSLNSSSSECDSKGTACTTITVEQQQNDDQIEEALMCTLMHESFISVEDEGQLLNTVELDGTVISRSDTPMSICSFTEPNYIHNVHTSQAKVRKGQVRVPSNFMNNLELLHANICEGGAFSKSHSVEQYIQGLTVTSPSPTSISKAKVLPSVSVSPVKSTKRSRKIDRNTSNEILSALIKTIPVSRSRNSLCPDTGINISDSFLSSPFVITPSQKSLKIDSQSVKEEMNGLIAEMQCEEVGDKCKDEGVEAHDSMTSMWSHVKPDRLLGLMVGFVALVAQAQHAAASTIDNKESVKSSNSLIVALFINNRKMEAVRDSEEGTSVLPIIQWASQTLTDTYTTDVVAKPLTVPVVVWSALEYFALFIRNYLLSDGAPISAVASHILTKIDDAVDQMLVRRRLLPCKGNLANIKSYQPLASYIDFRSLNNKQGMSSTNDRIEDVRDACIITLTAEEATLTVNKLVHGVLQNATGLCEKGVISSSSLLCEVLSGGNSNEMYKLLTHNKNDPSGNMNSAVIVRIFGSNHGFCDVGRELDVASHVGQIMAAPYKTDKSINDSGGVTCEQYANDECGDESVTQNLIAMAPEVLLVFDWGRCEVFLDGVEGASTATLHSRPMEQKVHDKKVEVTAYSEHGDGKSPATFPIDISGVPMLSLLARSVCRMHLSPLEFLSAEKAYSPGSNTETINNMISKIKNSSLFSSTILNHDMFRFRPTLPSSKVRFTYDNEASTTAIPHLPTHATPKSLEMFDIMRRILKIISINYLPRSSAATALHGVPQKNSSRKTSASSASFHATRHFYEPLLKELDFLESIITFESPHIKDRERKEDYPTTNDEKTNKNKIFSPVILSHNDLNPGNFLVKHVPLLITNTPPSHRTGIHLYILDFEYSNYNIRAFDLGNMVCELDYHYDFPDATPGGFGFSKVQSTFFYDGANSCCFAGGDASDMRRPMMATYPKFKDIAAPVVAASLIDAAERYMNGNTEKKRAIINNSRKDKGINYRKYEEKGTVSKNDFDVLHSQYVPPDQIGEHIFEFLLKPYAAEWNRREHRMGDISDFSSQSLNVNGLVDEVLLGMMMSHLFWGLWAIVVGSCAVRTEIAKILLSLPPAQRQQLPEVPFNTGASGLDNISYAECRLTEYVKLKKLVLKRRLKGLSPAGSFPS